MRIYFSGIGGVGIGPLAQLAHDAGYEVIGSDSNDSLTVKALIADGITVHIGEQTGEFLREQHGIGAFDYFVYTAALPHDHPELLAARELGLLCLKRDGLLARIISDKNLEMLAVAGTHGKTTTSGLLVWTMKQLGIPVSYNVGTTLSFGRSGEFASDSQYFVYECDEYDRNFLHFTPQVSLITSIDYDHPDTYRSLEEYQQAFTAFIDQSDKSFLWGKDYRALGIPELTSDYALFDESIPLEHLRLPGTHVRQNAFLVERALLYLFPDTPYHDLIAAINSFPGTDRRMERLDDNLYSDYGHHPAEIAATLQLARELSDNVVLVYQPHQNTRQHMVRDEYTDAVFNDADKIYWLPTYLSREDSELPVLTPQELTTNLTQADAVNFAELDDALWHAIQDARTSGKLVLCMGAGSIDGWIRQRLNENAA